MVLDHLSGRIPFQVLPVGHRDRQQGRGLFVATQDSQLFLRVKVLATIAGATEVLLLFIRVVTRIDGVLLEELNEFSLSPGRVNGGEHL